jgi:hypothetical protein
LNWNSSGLA